MVADNRFADRSVGQNPPETRVASGWNVAVGAQSGRGTSIAPAGSRYCNGSIVLETSGSESRVVHPCDRAQRG
jgi:hypothetical protein